MISIFGPLAVCRKTPRHSVDLLIQFFYRESAEACMRGVFSDQGRLFSYISPEARVPANHPLRKIRKLVRDVLGELNRRLFAALRERRPSFDRAGAIAERLTGKCSTASGRNASGWSNWTTIFCTAGSWDFRPTTWCGTRPCSRRIATGCRAALQPRPLARPTSSFREVACVHNRLACSHAFRLLSFHELSRFWL